MNSIYLVEERNFYYYDEKDQENVEENYIIGYFSTLEKAQKAISLCVEQGILRDKLFVEEIPLKYSRLQRNVYVLCYDYAILDDNNEYQDYFYKFPPCTNRAQCMRQKAELLKQDKFSVKPYKIFYNSSDGFYVDKIAINFVGHVVFKNRKEDKPFKRMM